MNILSKFIATLGIVFFACFSFSAWAINVNTASAKELQSALTGVGPVKAQAIVDYRKKNGRFDSTSDLLKVPGVGKATIDSNRSSIEFDSPQSTEKK